MYITISDISKTLYPTNYIDNRSGNLKIGLRKITFCFDWYNSSKGYIGINNILEGYSNMAGVLVEFNENTGKIKFSPTEINRSTTFKDPEVFKMLKIKLQEEGSTEKCTVRKPCESYTAIDLSPIKLLNIHCNQIDSTENFFNEIPSTLLTSVPIGDHIFGDLVTYNFTSPEYKKLKPGNLSELKFDIFDQDNKEIIHHSEVPVNCTFEIIS